MKRTLTLIPAAIAAIAIAMTPAMAKTKKHRDHHRANYSQQYNAGPSFDGNGYEGRGWNTRNVSDPSYNSNVRFRANNANRCTEDLGYGRYEYCGW